jgi:hypothetical protein
MAESAGPSPGRIFISYRRDETAYPAGWLFDRLVDRFGGQVFKDVDSIELGDDFVEVITGAVGSCDVLLALIGDQWLTITDEDGRRRLDDPTDFVRLEIEAALKRDVRVIPILVAGARMPRAADLPRSLAKLVRRQALELSPARFDFDTGRLFRVLDKTLAEVRAAQEHAAAISESADKAPELTTAESPTAPERHQQAESSPTDSIPPAEAAPTGSSPSELSKPLGRSTTEIEEGSELPESAKSTLMPSARPAAPAGYREAPRDGLPVSETPQRTGEAGPPPGESQPSDTSRWHLSRRAWILAGAGVAALILLVVVAVVSSSRESAIFEDDFSSRASGWTDEDNANGSSHYKNDAYRIHAKANQGQGGVPESARTVYPTAPPSINIDVEARRIAGSPQTSRYGILCRSTEKSWYAFAVEDKQVTIWRHSESGDDAALDIGTAPVAVDGTNELSATCEETDGGGVYLQFLVNGESVAEITDANPVRAGTVGLFTGVNGEAEVEFDNFVVRKV